jgi:hypothetical protein
VPDGGQDSTPQLVGHGDGQHLDEAQDLIEEGRQDYGRLTVSVTVFFTTGSR